MTSLNTKKTERLKTDAQSRKLQITEAALQLFAENGYKGTTTLLIARKAKVSEALIFKHFGKKEKLIVHLIQSGYEKASQYSRGTFKEVQSFALIQKAIELPSLFVQHDPVFWKLQKRLMSEIDFSQKQHARFIKPVESLMKKAFTDMGYADAEKETGLLLLLIDALWKSMLNDKSDQYKTYTEFIASKYSVKK